MLKPEEYNNIGYAISFHMCPKNEIGRNVTDRQT